MKDLSKEFTKENTIRTMYDNAPNDTNEGLVCIIKMETLAEKYRKPKYQLFRVSCGFGVSPSKGGNACYGNFCFDGEEVRWEKYNFVGVGNEEVQKIGKEMEDKRIGL